MRALSSLSELAKARLGFFGQVVTGLTHPLTVARAYLRMLFRRSA